MVHGLLHNLQLSPMETQVLLAELKLLTLSSSRPGAVFSGGY